MYCGGRLVGLRVLGRVCNVVNSPAVMLQTRWFPEWIQQQFARTDNPAAGPVGPPGTLPSSASTVILSTIAIAFGLFFSLGA